MLLSGDPVSSGLFSDRLICGGASDGMDWTDAPVVFARLIHDTGASATDGLTQVADIGGSINSRAVGLYATLDSLSGDTSVDMSASLGRNGSFTITSAQLTALAGGVLGDGAHTLRLFSLDAAGNRSGLTDVTFMLDTKAPPIRSLGFSAADSINELGTQTAAAVSQLKGMAEAGATIMIAGQASGSTASANGAFVLPGARLELGANVINLTATDAAGNQTTFTTTLVRAGQQQRDAVLAWNDMALAAIKLDVSDPVIATRVLAIQSVAVYDTLAAIEGTPAFLVQRAASGATSADAAFVEAAYQVLYALYPGQRASFDAARATSLAQIADGTAKTAGIELGKSIAQSVLTIRAADGYLDFSAELGNDSVGMWRPTGPVFIAAQAAQWGAVSPFALSSGDQFRPATPPGLDSAAYASALSEVRSLGGDISTARTADQTQQVHFWADGGGSVTPPGHWNQIASQIATERGNSLSANARLMAELNIALADAAIATWDSKYTYGRYDGGEHRFINADQIARGDHGARQSPADRGRYTGVAQVQAHRFQPGLGGAYAAGCIARCCAQLVHLLLGHGAHWQQLRGAGQFTGCQIGLGERARQRGRAAGNLGGERMRINAKQQRALLHRLAVAKVHPFQRAGHAGAHVDLIHGSQARAEFFELLDHAPRDGRNGHRWRTTRPGRLRV